MKYRLKDKSILILLFFSLLLILFGLVMDSPKNIYNGLVKIILERDILLTDYIVIGGIGATFINVGLLSLIFVLILYFMKIPITGISYAAILSITGFSFFGKNIFNVWFIIIGVYLYAKVKKEKFSQYIYVALFGTAMSPITTELIFSSYLPWYIGVPLGILVSILIGFILAPVSTHTLKIHQGYSLYNIGFTAGLISTIVVSIIRSYGYNPNTRLITSEGNNLLFGILLMVIFLVFIILGSGEKAYKKYFNLWKYSGRLKTDFIVLEGLNLALINMGLCGIISTLFVLICGGELNGPTIGGIFVVVGFGAYGKHPKNIIPIFLGVYIGALTKIWDIKQTSVLLAALFGTSLAPIAGEFGLVWGILAAYMHLSVALNVVYLYGGLNLYNNGFSAGLIATFLVPIIRAFKKEEVSHN